MKFDWRKTNSTTERRPKLLLPTGRRQTSHGTHTQCSEKRRSDKIRSTMLADKSSTNTFTPTDEGGVNSRRRRMFISLGGVGASFWEPSDGAGVTPVDPCSFVAMSAAPLRLWGTHNTAKLARSPWSTVIHVQVVQNQDAMWEHVPLGGNDKRRLLFTGLKNASKHLSYFRS